jgi:hypothetical protein
MQQQQQLTSSAAARRSSTVSARQCNRLKAAQAIEATVYLET